MAWSFRKRIKVIPGVHLNFSKRGISTSIGFKGASINIGKSGTYLNTSIPGLGLSNRHKISGGNYQPQSEPAPEDFKYLSRLSDNIFSADIQEITSQDMQGIKQAIFAARHERKDLQKDIKKIKQDLTFSKIKLGSSYILLYGVIIKKISQNLKTDITNQREALTGLQDCLENCYVKIEVDFEEEIKLEYSKMISSFKKLASSIKIWDITSAHSENRVVSRSAASTVVEQKEVKFGIKNLPEIKTEYPALHFQNANGADLFFYPTFIVMYQNAENFAMIGYNELNFRFSPTRFVEERSIPSDAQVIDYTWKKVNKNGTPDKRFKDNYQIPIVRYGTMDLKTSTGLNEEYSFSNFEAAEAFANAFAVYQSTIKNTRLI